EIIVVDDGSVDRTREIAREKGADVIRREGRKDLSKSIIRGIEEASHERVVVMDGDGQHPPGEIPEILQGLEEKQ
ncbi:MAG: glycosyltransferase family 2 protein, partial [Candidatus Nanohaloarchaea archaeon]